MADDLSSALVMDRDACWENGHGDWIKLLASGRMDGVGYNPMLIPTTFSAT